MDRNQAVFDRAADQYTDLSLMPAERAVLKKLRDRLPTLDMLDLGVGTGRTGYTFAALVHRYVGVDYSPRMIDAARTRLGSDPEVELVVGDARDLSPIEGSFDFVLFSFNGIDAAAPQDRLTILREVRRKLRSSGRFLFSSHSLGALPFDRKRPLSPRLARSRLYRIYAFAAGIRYAARIRQINRGLDLATARRRHWTVVNSMAHDFQIFDYYIEPAYQVEQLRETGFAIEAIYDPDGNEVALPLTGREPWFDYLCRPLGESEPASA